MANQDCHQRRRLCSFGSSHLETFTSSFESCSCSSDICAEAEKLSMPARRCSCSTSEDHLFCAYKCTHHHTIIIVIIIMITITITVIIAFVFLSRWVHSDRDSPVSCSQSLGKGRCGIKWKRGEVRKQSRKRTESVCRCRKWECIILRNIDRNSHAI